MPGEFGISPELSEEIEAVGEGGGCRPGEGPPVRGGLEGGMLGIEGECARLSCFMDS